LGTNTGKFLFGIVGGLFFSGFCDCRDVDIFRQQDGAVFFKDQATMTAKNGRWINLLFAAWAEDLEGGPTSGTVVGGEVDRRKTFRA
jgi:hypothetical protein